VFSNLFSITLPNIEKYFPGIYFPGIHFPKENYFPANKRGLREYKLFYCAQNNKRPFYPTFKANCVIFTMQNRYFTIPIYDYNYCRVINVHGRFSFFLTILYYKICIVFHKQLNFSLLLPFHACKTSNLVLSFWEWESPPRTPKAQEHKLIITIIKTTD